MIYDFKNGVVYSRGGPTIFSTACNAFNLGLKRVVEIMFACMSTMYLLYKCTDVKGNYKGDSLLDVAVKENKVDIAVYLTKHGCCSDEDFLRVWSMVHRSGKLNLLKELVEQHTVLPEGEIWNQSVEMDLGKIVFSWGSMVYGKI